MVENANTDLRRKPDFMSNESYQAAMIFLDALSKIEILLAEYESGKKEYKIHYVSNEEVNEWSITTEYCSIGGCDLRILTYSSEADAKMAAMFMSEENFTPTIKGACNPCYREYMQDAY